MNSWLPLSTVKRFEPLARARGVSAVARSSRGFLPQYKRAGSPSRLPAAWRAKRDAFVARHGAQMRDEPLFDDKGRPTRRHLALIMWAYSPTPERLSAVRNPDDAPAATTAKPKRGHFSKEKVARIDALVKEIQAGDVSKVNALDAEVGNYIIFLAKRFTKSAGNDAWKDVAQETRAKVAAKIGTFGGRAKFTTWIYTIAKRTAMDFIRTLKRAKAKRDREAAGYTRSQSAREVQRRQVTRERMAKHGPIAPSRRSTRAAAAYNQVLKLREEDGLTYSAIAERLDIPIGTVMSRLYTARRLLGQAPAVNGAARRRMRYVEVMSDVEDLYRAGLVTLAQALKLAARLKAHKENA